ncbi:calcium-binding protein [Streptomyces lasiicapitis]|uniref:calcium-binding protein n=1 Tax=Streptomyces lasiicapitis TaxID=1923961 RepID=UPI0036CFEE58
MPTARHRTRRTRPLGLATALACAAGIGTATLTAAPAATAAPAPTTAQVKPDLKVHYTAAAGQANDVTITYKFRDDGSHSGLYDFTLDDRVPLTAGAGCAHPDRADRTKVVCTVPPPGDSASDLEKLIADTGDGNDRITVDPGNNAYLTLHGGKGDDTLKANGYVTIHGDAGADRTTGGGGAWGEGAFGGAGDDTMTGCASACDGGTGNDTLTGTDRPNSLAGGDGNDTVRGKAGKDDIRGGRGDDKLYGDRSDDTVFGNSGNDLLRGGAGNDKLSGGPGRDDVRQN